MEPELDELPLLRENTEVDSFDCCDPIVDGWTQLLGKGKKIFFEELFKNDVEGRDEKKYIQEKEKEKGKGRGRRKGKGKGKEKAKDNYGELKDIVEAGFKNMGEIMARMDVSLNGKLESLGKRVGEVENFVGYNDFVGQAEEEDEEEAERQEEEALRKQQEEEEAALRKQQEEEEEALRKQKEEEEEALRKQREEEEEALRKQQEEEEEALRKQREEEEEALRKQREQEEEALRKQQEEEEEGGGSTEDVEVEEVVVKAVKKRARGSYKPPVTRASKKPKK